MKPFKKWSGIFICLYFPFALFSQTTISGGNLTGPLPLSGSPYLVTADVTVPVGGVLTIQPGVQMQFANYAGMIVEGQLLVNGTSSAPVLFTSADTTGFSVYTSTSGAWAGINFVPSITTDTSEITHAVIEYAKSVGSDWTCAAVNFQNRSNVIISSSEFRYCVSDIFGTAIYCTGSSPQILDCSIHNTRAIAHASLVNGGAIGIYAASSPYISHCTIYDNTTPCGGAIFIYGDCNPFIGWCDIHDNFAESFQGGGIYMFQSSPVIYHNRIHHNNAYQGGGGILVCGGSNPDIDGNLICNNFAETCGCGATDGGAGIRVQGLSSTTGFCKPIIHNNCISNNHTLDSGSGIYVYFSDAEIFNNNIAYNYGHVNGAGVFGWGSIDRPCYINMKNNIISDNVGLGSWNNEQVEMGCYLNIHLAYNSIQGGASGVADLSTMTCNVTYDATNFTINPLWTLPPAGIGPTFDGTLANWTIPLNSPARNAGDPDTSNCYVGLYDFAGGTRLLENQIDVGACEIGALGVFEHNEISTGITVFPNPAKEFAFLHSDKIIESNSKLQVFSAEGKRIDVPYTVNGNEIRIGLFGIASGMYTVMISTREGVQSCPLIVAER